MVPWVKQTLWDCCQGLDTSESGHLQELRAWPCRLFHGKMRFGCGIFPFKAGLWWSLSACGAVSGLEYAPPRHCHVVLTFGLQSSWIDKVLHVFFLL